MSTPHKGSERRAWLLALIGFLAIGGALAVRWQTAQESRKESSLEARLRASADDAVAALGEQLSAMPPEQRVPLLIRYADDRSSSLRYAAIDALGGMKRPETLGTIQRAFQDNSSLVRQRAAEVLHEVDPRAGVDLLRAALRDEDRWVRESAAMQFMIVLRRRDIPFEPIAASLVHAMDPEDFVVCRTAAYLLSRRTGKPWRIRKDTPPEKVKEVIAKWREWWQGQQKRAASRGDLALPEPVRPSRKDPAPDFAFRDLDGKLWSLERQRGRLTLLHFWATWCGVCRAEMVDLGRLDQAYRSQGLDILGLTLADKDPDRIRDFATKHGAGFPLAIAPHQVTVAFGHIHEVPVSVLIDRAGMIRYRWDGERDYATFEKAVRRLLAE